tara:strand:- start:1602 stop:1991 length:390 start_codon:yes stop_codon:yes gene_type:complete
MPHPKVKISDNSGNEVSVTSNRLDVNAIVASENITDMTHGIVTVGTSAMQLDGGTDTYDVSCKRIDMQANSANTGDIYIGSSNAIQADGDAGGIKLSAGDFYSMDIDNLDEIWIEATTSGQKLNFIYFT